MRSLFSLVRGLDFGTILPVMISCIAFFCLVLPAYADETGYTDGAPLGAPDWLLQRMDTSIMPDLFIPKNSTSSEETKPTVRSYMKAGNDLLTGGSFSEAKRSYEGAINLKPDSFDAWTGRGMALEGLKRYQTALDSYNKALGYSNTSTNVWLAYAGKGRVSYHLQDYTGASKALETAIDEFARSGESNVDDLVHLYETLADAKEKLGDAAGVSDAMKKATDFRSTLGSNTTSFT